MFLKHGYGGMLWVMVPCSLYSIWGNGQEFLFWWNDFAGTGDHGFDRRLRLGGPLIEKNIATMVLER